MAIKVMLDAGHYWGTSGKRTPPFTTDNQYAKKGEVIRECEQNYKVMGELAYILKEHGIAVYSTNGDINKNVTLTQRVALANSKNVDYFISIHKNAVTGTWQTGAKGIDTHIYAKGGKAEAMANKIQSALISETGMYNRGVRVNNFQVVRETNMPAVLLELGFMDYLPEALQMRSREWHKKFAVGIAKGFLSYVGITYKDPYKTTEPAPAPKPVEPPKVEPTPEPAPTKSWKQELGEKCVVELHEKGILTDLDGWKAKNMEEPVELWSMLAMLNNMYNKLK